MMTLVENLPVIFLNPAELYISEKPAVVTTVLGSCVSVTMFHRRVKVAGICHALLSNCLEKRVCEENCGKKNKYLRCVIPEMVRRISRFGVKHEEIEVKLFGGADMFGAGAKTETKKNGNSTVGSLNVQEAVRAIEAEGLGLNSMDVGGFNGRKIHFFTHTGEVFLKRLKNDIERKTL